MPIKDRLQILLPRAMDRGRGVIASRQFDVTLFCRPESYFRLVRLERIQYSPSWVKVECHVYKSGQEILSVAGADGEIPIELDIPESEPGTIALFNNSIDSEARFNLFLIGWQVGEG